MIVYKLYYSDGNSWFVNSESELLDIASGLELNEIMLVQRKEMPEIEFELWRDKAEADMTDFGDEMRRVLGLPPRRNEEDDGA